MKKTFIFLLVLISIAFCQAQDREFDMVFQDYYTSAGITTNPEVVITSGSYKATPPANSCLMPIDLNSDMCKTFYKQGLSEVLAYELTERHDTLEFRFWNIAICKDKRRYYTEGQRPERPTYIVYTDEVGRRLMRHGDKLIVIADQETQRRHYLQQAEATFAQFMTDCDFQRSRCSFPVVVIIHDGEGNGVKTQTRRANEWECISSDFARRSAEGWVHYEEMASDTLFRSTWEKPDTNQKESYTFRYLEDRWVLTTIDL